MQPNIISLVLKLINEEKERTIERRLDIVSCIVLIMSLNCYCRFIYGQYFVYL